MPWLHLLAYLFGGAALTNAVPHFVSAVTGRPFQTPFAKPPGQGLSSSLVNFLWAFANLVLAYWLLCRVGTFDLRNDWDAAALGCGMLIIGIHASLHFGRFHGGAAPKQP